MSESSNPLNGQQVVPLGDDWPLQSPSSSRPTQDGDLVSLNIARGWLPRAANGRKISLDTLYRWCQKGLKNGVRLEAVKVGSRWFTTRRWIQDFVRAGRPNLTSDDVVPGLRTGQQRRRASDWAEKELQKEWKKVPRNSQW